MGFELERNIHVYIDNGTGKNRKILDLKKCDLTYQQKKALVSAHAVTGNDYVASLLCKRKKLCWKLIYRDQWFSKLCAKQGAEISLTEATYAAFKKYERPMGNVKKDLRKTNVR